MSDMATRQKYHRITVFPDEYGTDEPFMSVMDILKRPLLGQYVRHIKCCAPLPMYTAYEVTESQRGLNDEDMKLKQKAVRKAGFTGPDEQQVVNMLMQRRSYGMWTWFQENDHQKPRMTIFTQALTSILIAVSPSLVSMAITEPVCRGFGHPTEQLPLAEFLRWANSEPESKPFLQNLRDVYLINNNNNNRWDETCYQEMDFYGCCGLLDSLPPIESVSADLVESNSGCGKSKFVEKCSNISRMSLHHSALGSVYLARLIWSCKSLREFQCSIGGRSPGDGEYPIVNLETLLKVLCGHKETLEIVDLDCESGMDFLDEDNTSHIQQHETPFEPHIKKKQREFLKAIWSNGSSLK
ncbi:hypothetical protein N7523_007226 [Penicillium sp. IBT 18751x]|nr:hypothetical protein N7523_007226 [Penicillium sp. IBT 18751x]